MLIVSLRLCDCVQGVVYSNHFSVRGVSACERQADLLGHYGSHTRPQVADRGTPSRSGTRVAPDKEGAADQQCLGEGQL